MRIAIRLALVFVVLIAVGLGALAVLLPRIVKSDAVRTRIEGAAREALGREVRYSDLDFGLLPPSLLVADPSVAGAAEGDPDFVRADEIALRVALMPLLAKTVVVDSLVIDGATLRLVRTPDGIELPVGSGEKAAPEPAEGEASPVNLAVSSLELRDATIVLEDRAVSPAVTWELERVDLSASGESLDAPIPFELSAELASGGSLRAEGSATTGGSVDATLALDSIALAPLRPYVTAASELAGVLSGQVRTSGAAASPSSLQVELSLRDADVAVDDVVLREQLDLKAELSGDLAAPNGRFDVDASQAELQYGETFRKPAGRTATLSGRLVSPDAATLDVQDATLQVNNLRADASVSMGKRTRIDANVAPFDLAGWDELVPALASYQPSGAVDIGRIQVATNPLDVRGKIGLDGIRATHPDAGPVTLKGSVEAKGDAIETRELALVAADQTVWVDATLQNLAATPRYRVRTRTEKADTNALVSAFTSRRDTFYGLLNFNGDVSGTGGDAPLQSMRGELALDIRDGRVVGLSLLHAVLAGLGESARSVATVAVNYGALAAPELKRYFREDFEALTGTLRVANGVARTDDLRLDYRDYSAELDGSVGLEETEYDLGCSLTLGETVGDLLARKLGGEPGSLDQVSIPARLIGRLDAPFELGSNPRVVVPPSAAVAFFQKVYLNQQRGQAARKIDEALGEGAGEQVLDVLDGILGGGQRR